MANRLIAAPPRVLVLAPTGIDARLTCEYLATAGLKGEAIETLEELCYKLTEDCGVAVICEESLRKGGEEILADSLQRQPSWSDIPLIVLLPAYAPKFEGRLQHLQRTLGHVTLLERPVRPQSLLASIQVALRSRYRQYEIRHHLQQREVAARALRDGERRYRSLVEASSTVVWVSDRFGRLSINNDRWFTYTGVSRDTQDFTVAVHPAERHQVSEEWHDAIHRHADFRSEFRLKRAEGGFTTVSAKAVPVLADSGEVIEWIGACTDIEQQRRAEDALRQSEKLAVAGRMAASIAHEINNPLAAVINMLFLIEQANDLDVARGFAIKANSELSRVIDVVGQTLSYYRQNSMPSHQNPAHLMDSVLVLMGARLRSRGIVLDKRYRGSPELFCFPGELKQVFANLFTNAVDAMPDGGRLILSCRLGTHGKTGKPVVRVSVADTGSGINNTAKSLLFEPFFSTKGEGGTGLGLWITSEILKKHAAQVRVKSRTTPGRSGTVFSISFPIHLLLNSGEQHEQEGKGKPSVTATLSETSQQIA